MSIISGHSIVACLVAAAPIMAQQIPVTERTLSNGMRVLLVERHGEPSIAAGWVARVGSADEHVGITGMAHLFEHMMFKGTTTIGTRNPKEDSELNDAQDRVQAKIRKEYDLLREKQRRGEIADIMDPAVRTPALQRLLVEFEALVAKQRALIVRDELDKIYQQEGAQEMNAATSKDQTRFFINVPANKLELWAWLESDRLRNAVFREFYSERDVVLEERRQTTESTPTGVAQEQFDAMLWQAHPYSWPILGWPSDICQVTREDANRFFATYYAPNNLTAVLVGDFNADDALRMMERYFGRIPANPRPAPQVLTQEPAQLGEQRMVVALESEPMVVVAFKTVPWVHRDAAALKVLALVLRGNSGRLTKELVLRQKVATSVAASMEGRKYGGTFFLEAAPMPDGKLEDLEPALYREIEKIAEYGVTEHELQKVKNQVQTKALLGMESNMGLHSALLGAEGDGSYKDYLAQTDLVQAVTNEDIQRVARNYFAPENRNVMLVRRKEAKQEGPVDPGLSRLPARVQAELKQILALPKEKMKEALSDLENQAGQMTAGENVALEYMIKRVREAAAAQEGK